MRLDVSKRSGSASHSPSRPRRTHVHATGSYISRISKTPGSTSRIDRASKKTSAMTSARDSRTSGNHGWAAATPGHAPSAQPNAHRRSAGDARIRRPSKRIGCETWAFDRSQDQQRGRTHRYEKPRGDAICGAAQHVLPCPGRGEVGVNMRRRKPCATRSLSLDCRFEPRRAALHEIDCPVWCPVASARLGQLLSKPGVASEPRVGRTQAVDRNEQLLDHLVRARQQRRRDGELE